MPQHTLPNGRQEKKLSQKTKAGLDLILLHKAMTTCAPNPIEASFSVKV